MRMLLAIVVRMEQIGDFRTEVTIALTPEVQSVRTKDLKVPRIGIQVMNLVKRI